MSLSNRQGPLPNLHVVQVITSPVGGGAETLVRELGTRLDGAGTTSEVIFFNANDTTGEAVHLCSHETSLGLRSRSPMAVIRLRRLLKKIRQRHPNVVVHAHLTWPFFYTALASLFLGLDLVYTEHSTTNKRREIRLLRPLDKLFYSFYRRIVCISDGVLTSLQAWLGNGFSQRITHVANGARIYPVKARARVPAESGKARLISVGSLTKRKGFDTAIQAVGELAEKIEEYVIVGEGPERTRLETMVAELGLENKVRLIGWSSDVESLLYRADTQLIPSVWEGFGLAAVEGMSTGLPIIASDVPGLREVLGTGNPAVTLVTDHRNPQAWADRLQVALEKLDGDLSPIREAARVQAEKFGIDRMVAGYRQVYIEVAFENV